MKKERKTRKEKKGKKRKKETIKLNEDRRKERTGSVLTSCQPHRVTSRGGRKR